jgi:uncharacterized LabA/DUF88 family protein
VDIELAVDVLELAPRLDHVVLFSGDGDFRRLVEAVQRRGVRVTVVSTIRCTAPGFLDKWLSYAARLKVCSFQAARMASGLRWPFFSISHSAL